MFYDVTETAVEVLGIIPKEQARCGAGDPAEFLRRVGKAPAAIRAGLGTISRISRSRGELISGARDRRLPMPQALGDQLGASGSKLPSDLLGLTCVRYGDATTATEMRAVNQKLRKAIEDEGRVARIEGLWWQFSLTERSSREPSAVSLLRISRDRDGALELGGRSWQEDGTLSARYWSEAAKERKDPPSVFYSHGG